jgi:hypothetical protein
MQLSVHWYGNGKYADVTVHDSGATIEVTLLNAVERMNLANHLREFADDLSPTSEGD